MQELIFVVRRDGDEWHVEANGSDCGVLANKERALQSAFRWAESSYRRGYLVSVGLMNELGDLRVAWWAGEPLGVLRPN